MRLSDVPGDVLVCLRDTVAAPFDAGPRPLLFRRSLILYPMGDLTAGRAVLEHVAVPTEVRRYLDRFHLVVPKNDPALRQDLLDGFFALIAPEYEAFIDVERNRENVVNLLNILRQVRGPLGCSVAIDYGCGTGLASEVAEGQGVRLIGVDSCPEMRRLARRRGMTVVSPRRVLGLPLGGIAGVVASYVLHLRPDVKELCLLWERLDRGAAVVGNFHKSQGVEHIERFARELGCSIMPAQPPPGSERHGPYLVLVKQD